MIEARIIDIFLYNARFSTSENKVGSDAVHPAPDYSCAYIILQTDTEYEGYAFSLTLGRGTKIVLEAIQSLFDAVVKDLTTIEIYGDFASLWRKLAGHHQFRWLGPEKGIIHMAAGALVNALWDLWARIENKPLWKLLVDMPPEQLVSTIDFKYISDVINKEEAIEMLEQNIPRKRELEADLLETGYPAYTTQVGWFYSDEKIEKLCKEYMNLGFTAFKVKVGEDIDDDMRRCAMVRHVIGDKNALMMDANQLWEVNEAIECMKKLAEFKPIWIEEPTNPDLQYGHVEIQRALKKLNVGLATGEMFENRLKFKSYLEFQTMDYCQIDAVRVGGINEILSIYFMAKIFKIPVCPHAGGVGLCEMVQHLQMWDYICLSQTKKDRMIEYVDQQHEHFEDPVYIRNACYMPPTLPGYSTKIKAKCIMDDAYE